jgi:CelD/BcsL family acetyltransferase involved in cellulose biosynthesis
MRPKRDRTRGAELVAVCDHTGTNVIVIAERGGIEAIERLAPQWRSLCMEGPNNEPFYQPEWFAAWLRAFKPPGELLLITAYIEGRLAGVLPLVDHLSFRTGFPVRKLRGAANVHSCRFDLIRGADRDGNPAVSAIWNFLRDLSEWDVIELPDVPEGGAGELLLELARKDGYLTGAWESIRSPYIPLAGVKDASAVPRSGHFRRNLRRRLSKAQAQYRVCLRRSDTADPSALKRFYELEAAGWKGRLGTSIASDVATRRFYDEIACTAARFGYFSLYLLEFDGQAVAAHYGLTWEGRYYSPKVAYDERFAAYGPGHLIVDAILRDCLERRTREFDFLGPSMEWKSEWTGETRKHAHCYVFRRGLAGRVLYTARFRVLTALRNLARQPAIMRLRRRIHVSPRRPGAF